MKHQHSLPFRRAVVGACLTIAAACTFKAQPPSGKQACSNDNPPQCPDGYACVDGLCYDNTQPAQGGSGEDGGGTSGTGGTGGAGGAGGSCIPATIVCGTGSGKRCNEVSDPCTGTTIKCGACISGESCGTGHVCQVACGQAGQPCCTGSKCNASGTVCDNGTCAACGGQNQICCAGDTCSAAGATCSDPSTTGAAKACLLPCVSTLGSCATGTDVDCSAVCGPSRIGQRTCTCASDAWKCLTCDFPANADYSCYKLPASIPACDPTTPPTLGATCSTATCSPCGSASGKAFVDATGATRSGYCVCDNNRWACSLTKDWPCPGNSGCQ
jgi:hypothetical protein